MCLDISAEEEYPEMAVQSVTKNVTRYKSIKTLCIYTRESNISLPKEFYFLCSKIYLYYTSTIKNLGEKNYINLWLQEHS